MNGRDLRYTVIDNNYTVLGPLSSAGENQPTREGYVMPLEGLAQDSYANFKAGGKRPLNMTVTSKRCFQR